jgi:hypothetical protein
MHVADRSANLSLKKFSKDIKGFAFHRPYPQMVFPVWSDCSNFDVYGADVNAQMPRSAHGFAFQLFETHGSGMNSKASMCLRTFVFLLASSIGFDFTLRPKDSKDSPDYLLRILANSSNVRNELANRFINLNYMIALI